MFSLTLIIKDKNIVNTMNTLLKYNPIRDENIIKNYKSNFQYKVD